jgi:hypothetical protein
MPQRHVTRWPIIGALVFAAAASYPLMWRERCLTWGATPTEADGEIAGDEYLPDADLISTRAIEIDAPAAVVWPWLVQMGSGRGGAYTYDWIENLFGLDMRSADHILPEFQRLEVGDVMPVGANGPLLRVVVLDPERALVVQSEDDRWVWAFALRQSGASTRLVSRNRIRLAGMSPALRLGYSLVMEPGSLLMERKMLLGIRTRAERLAAGQGVADA